MVKVQKTTTTLPIFTVTTVSILIAGLLTILSVNIIPMQQAIAQVGSSANPNPNPQGQSSNPQGNPIGPYPQGSGPNQGAGGGGNPIGSTQGNPIGSSPQTAEQQGSEIQQQPPDVGGGCLPGFTGFNASQGRCFRG